ncbi:putative mitochondrial protein, partial [Mucuna pruriens]
MFDCNPVNTPMEGSLKLSKFDGGEKEDPTLFKSLVGSLRYLTNTRSDIMYTVGVVCRFIESPTYTHMKATKRILRYLKGTLNFGLFYSSNEFKLRGFCDTEHVAATSCTCQAIWLRRLLKEFNMNQEESTKIYIDNKSVQILVKNMVVLVHIKTQDQVTDIFIMSLKFEDFRRLRAKLGMQNFL